MIRTVLLSIGHLQTQLASDPVQEGAGRSPPPPRTRPAIAYLHGKTIRQRAEALISIAHPKFRNSLFEYCERTKWLQRNNVALAAATT